MSVVLTSVGDAVVGAAIDVAAVSGPWLGSDGGGFDDGGGDGDGGGGPEEPFF